jgi:predicted permease
MQNGRVEEIATPLLQASSCSSGGNSGSPIKQWLNLPISMTIITAVAVKWFIAWVWSMTLLDRQSEQASF